MAMTKKALITDIDNTLFDWFTMWHTSFSKMIEVAADISGISIDELYKEAQPIHQKYGTSEYAFILEELPSLVAKYGDAARVRAQMGPAIVAFRAGRNTHLVLYPKVEATLRRLRDMKVKILAFSESKEYYSSFRIKELGLDGIIDVIYCPEDHALPSNRESTKPLQKTECHVLHGNFKKPSPAILLQILSDAELVPEEVLYVGDSQSKDMQMAAEAGVDYLWFEYGATHLTARKEDYDLLRKVTHWSPAEVEAEKRIAEEEKGFRVDPSRTIHEYSEILNFI
jgi:FMN phosphatase YigB (HAD superfamily)